MSDHSGHLKPGSPHDQAASWTARKMSGAMSRDDHEAFRSWLSASPDNREALRQLEHAMAAIDLQAESILQQEFERELNADATIEPVARRRAMTALAASVAAIVIGAGTALTMTPAEPWRTYSTTIGEVRTVALADGTSIALNTDTSVAVRLGRRARKVRMAHGEALYAVAKDAARPFEIATPLADIVVTGTKFDVRAAAKQSAVYVLSGAVHVTGRAGGAAVLHAGDSAEVASGASSVNVGAFDPELLLGWREGKLRFNAAPLSDVVAELNRYFSIPIVISGAEIAALPVSGEFDIRDQDAAVQALCLIFELKSRTTAEGVFIEPALE